MPLQDQAAQKYKLAARCPDCGRQPTDRYSGPAVEYARHMPLDDEFRDTRCKCGCVYRIAWVALAYAQPVETRERSGPPIPWAA